MIKLRIYQSSPFRGSWVKLVVFFFFVSCSIQPDTTVCQFNTQLIYRYNRENTTADNVLPQYIQSLTEYIFDEQGVLYAVNTLPDKSCLGKFVSEFNLPQGKYSVITWGNELDPSKVNRDLKGLSTREEMMLYLDNTYLLARSSTDTQANSERLYYGYRTFSVGEYGVSKVNVDMTHSHCVLDITVRWKKEAEIPDNGDDFYMTIDQIPSEYMFMPQYMSKKEIVGLHNQATDSYPAQTSEALHYIPNVLGQEELVNHRNTMRMTAGRELRGQFITYRYRNNSHELLTIYIGDKPLAGKTLDLYTFFKVMGIDLDKTLRQEYDLLLEVDGNRITATMMTEITDWNEGGNV